MKNPHYRRGSRRIGYRSSFSEQLVVMDRADTNARDSAEETFGSVVHTIKLIVGFLHEALLPLYTSRNNCVYLIKRYNLAVYVVPDKLVYICDHFFWPLTTELVDPNYLGLRQTEIGAGLLDVHTCLVKRDDVRHTDDSR